MSYLTKSSVAINTFSSLLYEVVCVICGFILPRLILSAFGSEVNGLVSSIAQFLGFISFCEAGIGPVIRANLYKPLAYRDTHKLSLIVDSSNHFFRVIAYILVAYTILLAIGYPLFVNSSFDFVYVSSLILIIASSSFVQYYFGITNQLLLTADKLAYIPLSLSSITIILNTLACVILIKLNASIHLVKFATAAIFCVKPIALYVYVNKKYEIKKLPPSERNNNYIKQKWNGLAQHVAGIIQDNTPVFVLTIFSSLSNVSIYVIYSLVVNSIKQLIFSINSSISPVIGNLIAKNEKKSLNSYFDKLEWIIHNIVIILFTMTGILIVPFVLLYTQGIEDADYNVPFFALIVTLACAFRCIQLCYLIVIQAACHFKETQIQAIIEPCVNILVSVSGVLWLGLPGVAFGSLVSIVYRMLYLVIYLRKNILHRNLKVFFKQILSDVIIALTIIIPFIFVRPQIDSFLEWTVFAMVLFVYALISSLIINMIFYRDRIFMINTYINKNRHRNGK